MNEPGELLPDPVSAPASCSPGVTGTATPDEDSTRPLPAGSAGDADHPSSRPGQPRRDTRTPPPRASMNNPSAARDLLSHRPPWSATTSDVSSTEDGSRPDPDGSGARLDLERLDPRLKLAAIGCGALLAVSLDSLVGLGLLGAACLVSLIVAGLPRPQRRPLLIVVSLATWGTVVGQGLFYDRLPRTALAYLVEPGTWGGFLEGGIALYREGIVHGLIQSLRFSALILLGSSVMLTTSPDRLFLGLRTLGIPYGLSFMAVTALRFVPIMAQEFQTVLAVRRLRGYRPLRATPGRLLRVELGVLRPVVAKALRKANDLSASLSLRGFDPTAPRSSLHSLSFTGGERLALGVLLLFTASVLCAKVLYLSYLYGVWYLPSLRPLYGWVRSWL